LEPRQAQTYSARKQVGNQVLQQALGPGVLVQGLSERPPGATDHQGWGTGGARLVNREDLGTYVHIFSHIKYVFERITMIMLGQCFTAVLCQHLLLSYASILMLLIYYRGNSSSSRYTG
jgi:hypothetical protein